MTREPPAPQAGSRVVAVVVAYNRRALLTETLTALAAQTLQASSVVVVDNASTDGSGDLVAERFPWARLVRLDRNTGGAGGFAAGLAIALTESDPDWVWLMDDDTVPTPSALAELVLAANATPGVVVAGSRVVWTDGLDHPMNTPRRKPFARAAERRAAAARGAIPVRSSSFVSMLVAAPRARAVGLPVADYFIWNDDFEYSTRLLRGRRGIAVPASVVVHKTRARADTDADPGERFFNEVRNKVWMFTRSSSLSPGEKLLYGGATVRRWLRTIRRSPDRPAARARLARGLRAGLTAAPRPNTVVLAGLGEVTSAVAALRSERAR